MSLFLDDLTKARLEALGRVLQPPIELDKREKHEDLLAKILSHLTEHPQVREATREFIEGTEVGQVWAEPVGEGEASFSLNWIVVALDLNKQHIILALQPRPEAPEPSAHELAAEIVPVARVSIPGIRAKGLRDLGGLLFGAFSQDDMHVEPQGTTWLITAPRGRAKDVQDQVVEILGKQFGYHNPEQYITRQG